ncbi:MAG: hypothetical protein ABW157_13545 [Candidatus Thiodiazotropha sp. LLP2]
MQQQPQSSPLSKSVSYFAHMLAGISVFLLVPMIEQKLRPLIYDYFLRTFPHDISLWCSWGFVIVVTLAAFFGLSSLLQVAIQVILRRAARKALF